MQNTKTKQDVERFEYRMLQTDEKFTKELNEVKVKLQGEIADFYGNQTSKMEQLEKTVTQVRLNNGKAMQATNEALEQLQKTNSNLPENIQKLSHQINDFKAGMASMDKLNTTIIKIQRDTDMKVDCIWEHL